MPLFLELPLLFGKSVKPSELLNLLFFISEDRNLIINFLGILNHHFQYSNPLEISPKYYDKIYFRWATKQNFKAPETILEYDQMLNVFSQISICKLKILFKKKKFFRYIR